MVGENAQEVKITLSDVDQNLRYNFYLDDVQIAEGSLHSKEEIDLLPTLLSNAVLRAQVIDAQLLYNGKEWFVTFGLDDGIMAEKYTFEVEGESGKKRLLTAADITQITSLNTIFKVKEAYNFKEGQKVSIVYKDTDTKDLFDGSKGVRTGDSFWDNLDNRWGVIGLLVAFISLAVGSYFSTRRKRRFQNLLRKSNDMLLHFLRDKEKIEAFLLAKKEKIHSSMQKGKITENQFLILNKRIEDIDNIIHEHFPRHKNLEKSIMAELDEICSNGEITEKEFSRIMYLARKQQGLEANS